MADMNKGRGLVEACQLHFRGLENGKVRVGILPSGEEGLVLRARLRRIAGFDVDPGQPETRQVQPGIEGRIVQNITELLFRMLQLTGLKAVSYTHLDVYKRQT